MRFEINGKIVNFESVLGQAKPLTQWTTGESKVLDRLGYVIFGRDPARDQLTYEDLYALITYFAMKANRNVRPADVDTLTVEEFAKIAAPFVEQFGPRLFPKPESIVSEAPAETPFGNGSDTPPTASDVPAAGVPETSSA